MTSVWWSFHGGSWLPNTGHRTGKKITWTCMMYLFSDWIGANRMAGSESTKLRNITQCYQSTVWLLERSNIRFEQSTAANWLITTKGVPSSKYVMYFFFLSVFFPPFLTPKPKWAHTSDSNLAAPWPLTQNLALCSAACCSHCRLLLLSYWSCVSWQKNFCQQNWWTLHP